MLRAAAAGLFLAALPKAQQGEFTQGRVEDGGVTMEYHLFLPERMQKGRRCPLVFALHGNGQAAKGHIRGIAAVSTDELPVLVVAPQYQAETKFGAPVLQGAGAMFEQLLALLLRTQPVDPARVVLQGFSMGSNYSTAWLDARAQRDEPLPFCAVWLNGTAVPPRKPVLGVPFLLFVGEQETAVLGSINVREAVRTAYRRMFDDGMDVWYLEIAGMGHSIDATCHRIMRWHLRSLPDHSAVWQDKHEGVPDAARTACDHGRFAAALAALDEVLQGSDDKAKGKARALRTRIVSHLRQVAAAASRARDPELFLQQEVARLCEDLAGDEGLKRTLDGARTKLEANKRLAPEVRAVREFAAARAVEAGKRTAAVKALADGALQATVYGRRARAHLQALGEDYRFPLANLGGE